jgi:MFS superfamily sulfate permease-like transporter
MSSLTPILAYMPKFTLAAIVFDALARLVDVSKFKFIVSATKFARFGSLGCATIYFILFFSHTQWYISKRDSFISLATFLISLLVGIDDGLIVGVLLGWALNLTRVNFSPVTVQERESKSSKSSKYVF